MDILVISTVFFFSNGFENWGAGSAWVLSLSRNLDLGHIRNADMVMNNTH